MKKRVIVILSCIVLGLCSNINGYSNVNAENKEDYNSINDIIKDYYNDGFYTRKTYIHLNDAALNESLENYFIGGVSLERTTYFKGETLLMGNIDGTIGGDEGINSGYTTIDNDLYHFVYDVDNECIDETSYRRDVIDSSVTEFFITLKNFASSYIDNSWIKEGNTYKYYPEDITYNIATRKYNDTILDQFLNFTASCFYNADKNSYNYISLNHVEIEEVENHLELRLYSDQLDSGKLDNPDYLLSEARIYKGFLPEDDYGYYLVNGDSYEQISGSLIIKNRLMHKGDTIALYNSYEQKDYRFKNELIQYDGYYDITFDIESESRLLDLKLIYELIENRVYDEVEPDMTNVDETDLSELKNLFDSLSTNYTLETQSYFNKDAVERINHLYKTHYIQNQVTKVDGDRIYISDKTGNINNYYYYDGNIKEGKLIDGEVTDVHDLLVEKGNSYVTVTEPLSKYFFTFDNLTSEYIDTYGPTRITHSKDYVVDYDGWKRIGEHEYSCDRDEVISDFIKFMHPGFRNGGMYMTYNKVRVEFLEDGTIRFRLYCSYTQYGKVIPEHFDLENKSRWYLLIAEGYLSDIGSTYIN